MTKSEKGHESTEKLTGYALQHRNALKEETIERLSLNQYKWDTVGQTLVGKLESFESIDSTKYAGTFIRYIFDTDAGKYVVIFGAMVDQVLADEEYIGCVLAITYDGKKSLDGGKRLNQYTVLRLTN